MYLTDGFVSMSIISINIRKHLMQLIILPFQLRVLSFLTLIIFHQLIYLMLEQNIFLSEHFLVLFYLIWQEPRIILINIDMFLSIHSWKPRIVRILCMKPLWLKILRLTLVVCILMLEVVRF